MVQQNKRAENRRELSQKMDRRNIIYRGRGWGGICAFLAIYIQIELNIYKTYGIGGGVGGDVGCAGLAMKKCVQIQIITC